MKNHIYIVMGVSGSGKTTIGKLLAERLKIPFYDGDDFHSAENIEKMAHGIPLNDKDRSGWLKTINSKISDSLSLGAVFACSALKEKYRELLCKNIPVMITWVYLKGDYATIASRIMHRKNHYMGVSLLKSQFDILEEPQNAITIEISDNNPENIIENIMNKSDFGLVGLGVMGKSLARNLASKGVKLSLYNRFVKDKEENVAINFINEHREMQECLGFEDLPKYIDSLQTPRKIFLMINAGPVIDQFIETLLPHLSPNDIIIDGGNSHYLDTKRRIDYLVEKQIDFIGTGVSGGEKGALEGPSIMPSGRLEAYKEIAPFLTEIAARDKNNKPCSTYIGKDGAGHFVKMVHNGIEYAEMQLISEVYAYLRFVLKLNPDEIAALFENWNKTDAQSYLLEITAKLLTKKENENWLIDLILDEAGNKGTGNWTTVTASENGVPATIITSALFARYLSTIKKKFNGLEENSQEIATAKIPFENIRKAYQTARILNHQQGFYLIKSISDDNNWNLNLSEIARIWTNGCIIRSTLMATLSTAFKSNSEVFEIAKITKFINKNHTNLKKLCIKSINANLPFPSHTAALEYLNTLNSKAKMANIIQAQRDFFGAHTYKRIDDLNGKSYHTVWE